VEEQGVEGGGGDGSEVWLTRERWGEAARWLGDEDGEG